MRQVTDENPHHNAPAHLALLCLVSAPVPAFASLCELLDRVHASAGRLGDLLREARR